MQRTAQPGEPAVGDLSTLLRAWSGGDQSALDRLTPIVYDELRGLARRYMKRERPGHSLQTTALVNEAYMRLVDYKRMQWQNRALFFGVSGTRWREPESGSSNSAGSPERFEVRFTAPTQRKRNLFVSYWKQCH